MTTRESTRIAFRAQFRGVKDIPFFIFRLAKIFMSEIIDMIQRFCPDGVENEEWYIMKPNIKIFDSMKTLKLCRLMHNFL